MLAFFPPPLQIEDPAMRERVDQLILEEMGNFNPPDYLADFPLPSTTPFSEAVSSELERLAAGGPLPPRPNLYAIFDMVAPPADADADTLDAWERSLARAKVAVEAQGMRAINVELMTRYGVDAWKAHVDGVDKMHASMKAHVASLQSKIDAVNAVRRSRQEPAAGKLKSLVRKWHETLDSNLQVELACHDAQVEVKRLKKLAVDAGLSVES